MIKLALALQRVSVSLEAVWLNEKKKKGYFVKRNSMKQNPSGEANSSSATQEILCILQNLKVHCCIQKSPPLVPFLSCVWFCIMWSTYDDELLAPYPTPKLEEHLLSTVQDTLCNISSATPPPSRRPSPQSKTWREAMSWWQGATHFSGS